MPLAPNVTVSASPYTDVVIPTNTEFGHPFFSERNGYTTSISAVDVSHTFELGHDDILFETKELKTSLKELMNRIYKLEIDVYELKQQLNQGGTIKL